MQKKKGDTLIEVALAIGIFSLVAIVVVSVVSASVTSAQSSLELTLTREELDAQAEALRFIHDSYVNDSQSADTSENAYSTLWEELKKHVIDADASGSNTNLSKVTYKPTTCSELYDGSTGKFNSTNTNIQNTNPFIINIRTLGSLTNDGKYASPDSIVSVKSTDARSVFYEASTYPRILYGDLDQDLYSQTENTETKITRVEGIYIVGIEGNDNKIVSSAAVATDNKVSYYDFYIHSCWMPPGADRASTVSTVVRLYDPAAIMY